MTDPMADPMADMQTTGAQRPTGVEERPVGWWGMALTVMVVATTYAAMCFTYVYIRVSSPHWPPDGIAPPSLVVAGLAGAALAASGFATWLAQRRPAAGLPALVVLAAGHTWLVVADWGQPGFDATLHAYGSAAVILPAVHLSLVAIGMLMAGVLLAMTVKAPLPLRHVGLRALALWWYAVVTGGLILLVLVYGTPHVWTEPWPVAP